MLTPQSMIFTDIPILANPPAHVLMATRAASMLAFEQAYRRMEAHYERVTHNLTGNPATHVMISVDDLRALVEFRRGARSGWRH